MVEQEFVSSPQEQPQPSRKVSIARLVIGAWIAILGLTQGYLWYAQINTNTLIQQALQTCQQHPYGPWLFMAASLISPVLLIPAALLGGVAGACFGTSAGVVYTLLGCNLSALMVYGIGRMSSSHSRKLDQLRQRYGPMLKRNPFLAVILLRLSFLPYDPINYVIGMFHIRWWVFLLANTIGSLPGVLMIVFAGSALGQQLPWQFILIVAAIILVVTASAIGVRRRLQPSGPREESHSHDR